MFNEILEELGRFEEEPSSEEVLDLEAKIESEISSILDKHEEQVKGLDEDEFDDFRSGLIELFYILVDNLRK